jgi:ABC-type dipeptide/oligopeptide/nickel transport system permease component
VKEIWSEYWQADVYLLIGGLALGVVAGIWAAVFCAGRPRSIATRAVEPLGLVFYSMPAYLFGFGVLLLFEPSFGALPLPFFFHPLDYQEPFADPWMFVQAMIVPWIGQAPGTLVPNEPVGHIDIVMVQALALWTALLIVLVSALADVALAVLDPRVRATGRPVG